MADRTRYVGNSPSLETVRGIQADRGVAGLLGQVGQVAGAFQNQVMDYQQSMKVKTLNDSLAKTKVSLAEIAAKNPDNPAQATSEMDALLRGKAGELSKLDQEMGNKFLEESDLTKRLHLIGISKNWNTKQGDSLIASSDIAGESFLSDISPEALDSKEGNAAVAKSFARYVQSLNVKTPDGADVFTSQVKADKIHTISVAAADKAFRQYIGSADAALAAQLEQAIRDGNLLLNLPIDLGFGDGSVSVRKLIGDKEETYINLAQNRQRELKADSISYTGDQQFLAELDIENGLAAAKNNQPYRINPDSAIIHFGDNGVADYEAKEKMERLTGETERLANGASSGSKDYIKSWLNPSMYGVFDAAYDKQTNLMDSDPNSGLMNGSEEARAAKESFLAPAPPQGAGGPGGGDFATTLAAYRQALNKEYDKRGVDPARRYLLDKKEISSVVADIHAPNEKGVLPTALEKANRIQAFAASWGASQDLMLAQLQDKKQGGMEGVYGPVIDMTNNTDKAMIYAGMDQTLPALKKQITSLGKETELNDALASVAAPQVGRLLGSLPLDSQHKSADYAEAINILTIQKMLRGVPAKKAAEDATRSVIPFRFIGIDRLVRIPESDYTGNIDSALTPGMMRITLREIQDKIVLEDTEAPGFDPSFAKEQAIRGLYKNARFVTRDDGKGVYITTSMGGGAVGSPVLVKDKHGNPVPWTKTWEELESEQYKYNFPFQVHGGPG